MRPFEFYSVLITIIAGAVLVGTLVLTSNQALKAENAQLRDTIITLQRQVERNDAQVDAIQDEVAEVKTTVAANNARLVGLGADIKSIPSWVVPVPEYWASVFQRKETGVTDAQQPPDPEPSPDPQD